MLSGNGFVIQSDVVFFISSQYHRELLNIENDRVPFLFVVNQLDFHLCLLLYAVFLQLCLNPEEHVSYLKERFSSTKKHDDKENQ
jgi:hypothetical protein